MSTKEKRFIQSALIGVGKWLGITLHTPDAVAQAVNLAKVKGYQSAYYEALQEFNRVTTLISNKKKVRATVQTVKVRRRIKK